MEIGRVKESELDNIDFSLPADPAFNDAVLKGKPVKYFRVHIGCNKLERAEWVGKIYPPKTKEKCFFHH